jgi:translation elongation factor EF-G
MILSLFTRTSPRADTTSKPLWHPEYPIEQTVRTRDSEKAIVVREARRHRRGLDDALYVADGSALRILGRSEGALKHAIAELTRRHGDAFIVEPPSVRYVHGASVLEPWMDVLLNVPEGYGRLVKRDFARRRGSVRRVAQQGGAFVLEGEAPLADLLGYAEWLRDLTESDPNIATWLSRYRPVDDGPSAA